MNVTRITKESYDEIILNKDIFYNRADFCEYNGSKVDEVNYLLFSDEKKDRFVIPFGRKADILYAPFSAPYCLPGEIGSNTSAQHYCEAIEQLLQYAKSIGINKVSIMFPPFFYSNREIGYWLNACINHGGVVTQWDLNYAMNLKKIQELGYSKCLQYNGRKNLRLSHERGCEVWECTNQKDCRECYDVIKNNRESKGYPLRMTFDQVEWTRNLSKGKWFYVTCEEKKIASAVIFPVTPKIVQVIYWGNIPGSEDKKPVNALAEFLSDFYLKMGFEYLDIGPSTDQGVPNYGLIDFKESIGCQADSKIRVEIAINR